MNPDTLTSTNFGAVLRDHLEEVETANRESLDHIADAMLDVVTSDGLLYVTGTGHSIGLVLETFYRAGGLACVQPVYHASLLPLHGGQESTLCEHTHGLAALMMQNFAPGPRDLAFIFSNSGGNAVPVELADEFRARGCPVVAVVSLEHLHAAPLRIPHKIDAVATHILDTRVPYGDACYPTGKATTAGLSSLTGIFLWDLLLARLADRAGVLGIELPIWTSSNVAGGEERNQALFDRYGRRVTSL